MVIAVANGTFYCAECCTFKPCLPYFVWSTNFNSESGVFFISFSCTFIESFATQDIFLMRKLSYIKEDWKDQLEWKHNNSFDFRWIHRVNDFTGDQTNFSQIFGLFKERRPWAPVVKKYRLLNSITLVNNNENIIN